MGVSDQERYLFDLNGYLVVRGVLDPGEVARLNEVLDQQGLDDLDEAGREAALEWLPNLGGPFLNLIDHQCILPYLIDFVDERVRLDHSYGIQMVAGSPGLDLHGFPDDRPRNCAWYHVRNGTISAGLIVVSFALTEVSAADGGFVCVPGSHKANLPSPFLDKRANPDDPWLRHVELDAGDAVIFTEALTHGSLDWKGPGVRRALFYKYAPGQWAWLSHQWAPHELEPLTPRQRAMVAAPGVVYAETRQERRPIEVA
ncbi:Ectoine hydroxylase-related dioxygenase, phytanoyl-CoA dioxygenase (PhyH) family [Actinopolymorpha cephalotaxi]|nr:Ectoine hydroxylase-related dioxygenase, phytanoyl-CoA dioxygenase (PhyH) family [Actinopolymorpha cephalotaxi]